MDFTIAKYSEILEALSQAGYAFQTFLQFIGEGTGRDHDTGREENAGKEEDAMKKVVVLRHDVDRSPGNSLRFARMEAELGITASYYFRIVPQSFDPGIIREISGLGHEIGYHYEDLSLAAGSRQNRDGSGIGSASEDRLMKEAIGLFEKNLARLRELVPVKTICMHGSPFSRWDNRLLWERFNYHDHGIVAEPYFDVDYSQVFYITDTGRSWRRSDASVRDRVDSGFDLLLKSTSHLIELAESGQLPGRIMINTHPQRWHDPGFLWFRELIGQNMKNLPKRLLIRMRQRQQPRV